MGKELKEFYVAPQSLYPRDMLEFVGAPVVGKTPIHSSSIFSSCMSECGYMEKIYEI